MQSGHCNEGSLGCPLKLFEVRQSHHHHHHHHHENKGKTNTSFTSSFSIRGRHVLIKLMLGICCLSLASTIGLSFCLPPPSRACAECSFRESTSSSTRLFHLLQQDQLLYTSENQLDDQALQQRSQDWWNKLRQLYYNDGTTDYQKASNASPERTFYGGFPNGPVILGMERCEEFRRRWGSNGTIGVASLFNAGSNALTMNLQLNLGMPGSNSTFGSHPGLNHHGVWSQVPWWKHNPIISDTINGRMSDLIEHASVLPIVIVRDFYFWRKSTCTLPYTLQWQYTYDRGILNCPGFFRGDDEQETRKRQPEEITFRLEDDRIPKTTGVKYHSLVDIWNSFYKQYVDAPFPRLIIRFEDTLFYLPEILQAVQECAGMYWKSVEESSIEEDGHKRMVWSAEPGQRKVAIHRDLSKNHGNMVRSDPRISAFAMTIRKNAEPASRLYNMDEREQEYTRQMLDAALMQLFHYTYPSSI